MKKIDLVVTRRWWFEPVFWILGYVAFAISRISRRTSNRFIDAVALLIAEHGFRWEIVE